MTARAALRHEPTVSVKGSTGAYCSAYEEGPTTPGGASHCRKTRASPLVTGAPKPGVGKGRRPPKDASSAAAAAAVRTRGSDGTREGEDAAQRTDAKPGCAGEPGRGEREDGMGKVVGEPPGRDVETMRVDMVAHNKCREWLCAAVAHNKENARTVLME